MSVALKKIAEKLIPIIGSAFLGFLIGSSYQQAQQQQTLISQVYQIINMIIPFLLIALMFQMVS